MMDWRAAFSTATQSTLMRMEVEQAGEIHAQVILFLMKTPQVVRLAIMHLAPSLRTGH